MAFVNVERHFPPIRSCRDFVQIFLEALPVVVGDYRVSNFHIICEVCYEIVKSMIDVVYVYYEYYWFENRALWDATSDWCPIRG